MMFPGVSAGEKNEQIKLIVAGVFLCRLVIDQRALNFVLIALGADIFFWIMGVIGPSYSFQRAMFGLFGDTDSDITSGSRRASIGGEAVVSDSEQGFGSVNKPAVSRSRSGTVTAQMITLVGAETGATAT